jgi:hypothetical protein
VLAVRIEAVDRHCLWRCAARCRKRRESERSERRAAPRRPLRRRLVNILSRRSARRPRVSSRPTNIAKRLSCLRRCHRLQSRPARFPTDLLGFRCSGFGEANWYDLPLFVILNLLQMAQ